MAQLINKMLTEGINDLDELESLGKDLARSVKTSQIRKFFGSMRRIQADFTNLKHEIVMLEPRLAYAKGKAKGDSQAGLDKLYKNLGPMVKEIKGDKSKFDNFVQIVEAIVAYHKYYNGVE
ncbi:MAG: type III-A CRISPR-associated protein Csm2 [Bacteroidota bacterium]